MELDRTLLDLGRAPTVEEMKAYFQKHDYTTARSPFDVSKANEQQSRALATDVAGFAVDANTLFYVTLPQENSTFTVYVNYRNQRLSDLVLEGVTTIQ